MNNFSYIFYFIIFIGITNTIFSNNLHNNTYEYQIQPFDVISYDLKLEVFNPSLKNIEASNKITVVWQKYEPSQKFYFHLKNLEIDSITYNGENTDFNFNNTPSPLDEYYYIDRIDELDTAIITIYYHGTMIGEKDKPFNWGGVRYSSNTLFNLGVSMYDSFVSAARYWMPCFDHPQDKAKFKAMFITPIDFEVASNGLLIDSKIENNKKITLWEQKIDCATYLLNFAIAPYEVRISKYKNNLPIYTYNLYNDSLASNILFSKLQDMIECYENLYGAYPFEKVGFAITPDGSMEHQTMISIDKSVATVAKMKSDSINTTVAHELSHSWFGDLVTPKDFRDVWFNESFASHAEAEWLQYATNNKITKSNTTYTQKINDDWNLYLKFGVDSILPLYNPKSYKKNNDGSIFIKDSIDNYPLTIYRKGSVIVQLLKYEVGDSNYYKTVKHILNKYKFSNISTQEIKNEFETISNKNLDKFFDEWIYQKGFPSLKITTHIRNNRILFQVEQTHDESKYGSFSKIYLPLTLNTNLSTKHIMYEVTSKNQEFEDYLDINEKINSFQFNSINYVISPIKFNTVTSILDYYEQSDYKIYDKQTEIEIEFFNNPSNDFEIFNILGNQISKNDFIILNNKVIIKKSALNNGAYFLKYNKNMPQIIPFYILN